MSPRVELLVTPDCPHAEAAEQLVRRHWPKAATAMSSIYVVTNANRLRRAVIRSS